MYFNLVFKIQVMRFIFILLIFFNIIFAPDIIDIKINNLREYIKSECQKYPSKYINYQMIESIIYEESRWVSNCISPKGAKGLMQITWICLAEYNRIARNNNSNHTDIISSQLYNEKINIHIGIWYFGQCLEKRLNIIDALTIYNYGHNNEKTDNDYAYRVLNYFFRKYYLK